LYSVGAEGANTTLMPGLAFSKAGISFSCQMARSSLRQLSMVIVLSWAAASPAEPRMLDAIRSVVSVLFFISVSLVDLVQVRL
jgi:hypothetical protein